GAHQHHAFLNPALLEDGFHLVGDVDDLLPLAGVEGQVSGVKAHRSSVPPGRLRGPLACRPSLRREEVAVVNLHRNPGALAEMDVLAGLDPEREFADAHPVLVRAAEEAAELDFSFYCARRRTYRIQQVNVLRSDPQLAGAMRRRGRARNDADDGFLA